MYTIKNNRVFFLIIIFLIVAAITSLLFNFLYTTVKNLVIEQIGYNAQNIAVTTARFIEEDIEPYIALSLVEIYEPGSYDENYYLRMLKLFRDIKNETGAYFLFTEKIISETEIAYIFDGEDPESEFFSPIGSLDSLAEIERLAFEEGIPAATGLLRDKNWGDFLTGFAPIIDSRSGNVVGLVGVDFSIDQVEELLVGIKVGVLAVTLLLIFLASFIVYRLVDLRFEALEVDYLTGVYSKRYHELILKRIISRVLVAQKTLSLIMLDIDSFKEINDIHGHVVGDKVLQYVAGTIKNNIREIDICSRYGGDEFVIILPEANRHQAKLISERIKNKISTADLSKENLFGINITLSIGIAELSKSISGEELTQNADTAMYISKTKGKNRITVYGESI